MHSDPIADCLTRLRNGNLARHAQVTMPASNVKEDILKVLKHEGYIEDFRRDPDEKQGTLTVTLRYLPNRERVLQHIKRVSKPGLRVYRGAQAMPRIRNGLGIAVVSTSQGVLTDREARKRNVGGEILCEVW